MTDTVAPRAATGRLTVNPGDTVLSTWGNTTYDQTMEVFDTASQRDSQWPTPHDGALAYTLDTQTAWLRRSGTWLVFYTAPPPVTTGAGVQSTVDASGEVWVAKVGVAGGVWKKARDALHARVARAAAWTTASSPAANQNFDTVSYDAYGLHVQPSFICPVAGIYQITYACQATPTAANQFLALNVNRTGTLAASVIANTGGTSGPGGIALGAVLTDRLACAAGDTLTCLQRASAGLVGAVGQPSTWGAFSYVGTG
jgi:hypothetical protein